MEISFMEQAVIEIWRQAPHDVAALFWIAFFQVNGGLDVGQLQARLCVFRSVLPLFDVLNLSIANTSPQLPKPTATKEHPTHKSHNGQTS